MYISYGDKTWFILKDATQVYCFFNIHIPQSWCLKQEQWIYKWKVNAHVHQDIQKASYFLQKLPKL